MKIAQRRDGIRNQVRKFAQFATLCFRSKSTWAPPKDLSWSTRRSLEPAEKSGRCDEPYGHYGTSPIEVHLVLHDATATPRGSCLVVRDPWPLSRHGVVTISSRDDWWFGSMSRLAWWSVGSRRGRRGARCLNTLEKAGLSSDKIFTSQTLKDEERPGNWARWRATLQRRHHASWLAALGVRRWLVRHLSAGWLSRRSRSIRTSHGQYVLRSSKHWSSTLRHWAVERWSGC